MHKSSKRASTVILLACFAATLALSIYPSQPARSVTGEEVLDKMDKDERGAYIAGNIDMAAQLSHFSGQRERSDCIFDWYYNKNGVEQVVRALERFKDRQVQPVVYALIERACGK